MEGLHLSEKKGEGVDGGRVEVGKRNCEEQRRERRGIVIGLGKTN